MDRGEVRDDYRAALSAAMALPCRGQPEAALHAFLALNAGYFLGEWLPASEHAALVRRLATGLDGLANRPLPSDATHATQLAQHVRELGAEFGPQPWTARVVAETSDHVPRRPDDWDAQVSAAAEAVAGGADGHPLLLAHARRRLWELSQRAPAPWSPVELPASVRHDLSRYLARADDHGIQLVEALLAEASATARLAPALLGVLRQLASAWHAAPGDRVYFGLPQLPRRRQRLLLGGDMTQTEPARAALAAAYNYAHFPPENDPEEFRAFPRHLEVGSKAPDFEAVLLDGGTVRLSDYTRRGPTVIEFGSIT